ncbi:MAG: TIGR00730 family Rossman fold protein, partial [Candidatus Eremiobacteraeota bacterium]|nr:TIGR00730 family Rossman fold protein [Candidatus Eremiobacteraeota bacterium]
MRICVFCGSSDGVRPQYLESARAAGTFLANRGIGVVYGGGRVGLMGAVADAAIAAGGEVIGVIPEMLAAREVAHRSLTKLHVVGSMHERKALMAAESDAFLALPGGFGTLEELFEAVTWRQLGYHAKPCAVLNVAGYYDALERFCNDTLSGGFVREADRAG